MFRLWEGNLPDTEESRRAARVGGADPARLGLAQFVAERESISVKWLEQRSVFALRSVMGLGKGVQLRVDRYR